MKRAATATTLAVVVLAFGGCSGTPTPSTSLASSSAPVPDVRTFEVEVSGAAPRQYGVFVPPDLADDPAAVVVLHAIDDDGAATGSSAPTSIVEAARRLGFLAVVPTGVDFTWNAGTCCGTANARGVDDVAYLDAVIVDVVARLGADPARVYVVGLSNGAMMAYRLGCERADRIAGVGVVEGVLVTSACVPSRGVDLIQIHQTGDDIVPFSGATDSPLSTSGRLPAVEDGFGAWAAAQQCHGVTRADGEAEGTNAVDILTTSCRDTTRAQLVVVDGGRHDWPIGEPVDATEWILEFFGLETSGLGVGS